MRWRGRSTIDERLEAFGDHRFESAHLPLWATQHRWSLSEDAVRGRDVIGTVVDQEFEELFCLSQVFPRLRGLRRGPLRGHPQLVKREAGRYRHVHVNPAPGENRRVDHVVDQVVESLEGM